MLGTSTFRNSNEPGEKLGEGSFPTLRLYHRFVRGKLKRRAVISAAFGEVEPTTLELAAQEVLARFLSEDDPDVDLEFHKRIKRVVTIDYRGGAASEGAFEYGEVKAAIGRINPNKAPGKDGVVRWKVSSLKPLTLFSALEKVFEVLIRDRIEDI